MELLRRIAIESFAGVDAELSLVDVVLLEKSGQASLLLIHRRVDVVDGVQPDHVEDLERTQRRRKPITLTFNTMKREWRQGAALQSFERAARAGFRSCLLIGDCAMYVRF